MVAVLDFVGVVMDGLPKGLEGSDAGGVKWWSNIESTLPLA